MLSENGLCKSESFNSVSESQKSDSEVLRPKSLASVDRTDPEASRSPATGTGTVNTSLTACSFLYSMFIKNTRDVFYISSDNVQIYTNFRGMFHEE